MALDLGTELIVRTVFEIVVHGIAKLLRRPLYWTGWFLLPAQLQRRPPQHPLFCWTGVAFWLAFAALCAAAYWYMGQTA